MNNLSIYNFFPAFFILIACLSQNIAAEAGQKSEKLNTPPEVKIVITGIDKKLNTNAMAYLELGKSVKNPHFSIAWLNKLHKKAQQNISDALQPFGYYHAKTHSTLKQQKNNSWLAAYVVDKGEPVKIKQVDIIITGPAQEDPEVRNIIVNFPIKSGDILDHGIYEDAKSTLITSIARMGYSKITTERKKVLVDLEANHADLHIHLQSGIKYYLGDFNFHQDFLDDEFTLSYIQNIKPGDPYSKDKLLEIQADLLSSGYFSKVDVEAEYEKANNEQQIPVDIFLQASKRHKFGIGLDYDTQIGVNLSLRWQHRRINRYGHHSDITSKFSPKKSFLRGSYWMPTGNPHTDKYGIISKFETEDTDTTDRDTFDLQAGYWFDWQKWDVSIFSEYKYEQFTISNAPQVQTQLASLGFGAEKINFEKALFPRKGWALTGQVRVASEALASDIDYLRLYLKSRLFLPVAESGRLNLRAELGWSETSDFDLYPSSLRFYAGGDQSVRGYKWQALGPKDDDGEVIGGKNIFSASFEYDHKVSEHWVVAGFLDTGNAYNGSLDSLFWGAGFGLRYISPIGLISTDIGFPVSSDEDIATDKAVFYFGFEMTL